jgi:hypothetical protein
MQRSLHQSKCTTLKADVIFFSLIGIEAELLR